MEKPGGNLSFSIGSGSPATACVACMSHSRARLNDAFIALINILRS
jgi:hypothetical protein